MEGKMWKSWKIVILFFSFLLFILGIYYYFFFWFNNFVTRWKGINNNNFTGNYKKNDYTWVVVDNYENFTWDIYYYKKAIYSGNIDYCKNIKNKDFSDECTYNYLINNPKILTLTGCRKYLTGSDYYTNCLDEFYLNIMNCSKIVDKKIRSKCQDYKKKNEIISKEKDRYYCNFIKNEDIKNSCRKQLQKVKNETHDKKECSWSIDIDICDKYTWNDYKHKLCLISSYKKIYDSKQMFSEKKEVCKKIEKLDFEEWKRCYDNIYWDKAIEFIDYTICNKIYDEELKSKCMEQAKKKYAEMYLKYELCSELKDKENIKSCQDNVLLSEVEKKNIKDKKVCDKMNNRLHREQCRKSVSNN